MNMSLTNDDLRSIKTIVEDAIDDSKLQVAAGFAEVHEKFNGVNGKFDGINRKIDGLTTQVTNIQDSIDRIELKQQAEIDRDDRQDDKLKRIYKTLHLR